MNNNCDIITRINQKYSGMSKGHKKIASYIMEHYDQAAFMTAARLGEELQVSESTVVRFAAELGYSGYPAMQKALQEIIRGKLTSVQRIQASQDQMTGNDILAAVMQRDMDSIHTAIEQIDRKEFQRVVELLLNAQHIYILGVRSSSFLAGYLNFYFHLLFKNVIYVQNTAAGEIYEQMIHIGPGDVMVGISFPRYSNMGIHAMQLAHDRGADVIAITDSQMSPLYSLATAALLVRCEALSYVDSLAAPLSLMNALILAVGQRKREEVSQVFAEMEQVWSKYSIFGKAEDE